MFINYTSLITLNIFDTIEQVIKLLNLKMDVRMFINSKVHHE